MPPSSVMDSLRKISSKFFKKSTTAFPPSPPQELLRKVKHMRSMPMHLAPNASEFGVARMYKNPHPLERSDIIHTKPNLNSKSHTRLAHNEDDNVSDDDDGDDGMRYKTFQLNTLDMFPMPPSATTITTATPSVNQDYPISHSPNPYLNQRAQEHPLSRNRRVRRRQNPNPSISGSSFPRPTQLVCPPSPVSRGVNNNNKANHALTKPPSAYIVVHGNYSTPTLNTFPSHSNLHEQPRLVDGPVVHCPLVVHQAPLYIAHQAAIFSSRNL